jgi:hypothetical protein
LRAYGSPVTSTLGLDVNTVFLQQIDATGCRLIGAITKDLGHDGPKHHAVVLGRSALDGQVYVAELMNTGYQICTYEQFHGRYSQNGDIRIQPNDNPSSGVRAAQRALSELRQGGQPYDLLVNNCESFVNRAIQGSSVSSQVVNTALGLAVLVGLFYVLKNSK